MRNFIGYSYKDDVIGKLYTGDPKLNGIEKGWVSQESGAALQHLRFAVEKGYAIAPGIYKDGLKTKASFIHGQLVLLDYDDGESWEDAKNNAFFAKHAVMGYTTASHRVDGKGDRFRIIAIFPSVSRSAEDYDGKMAALRDYLQAEGFAKDDAAMRSAQCAFGNPHAEVVFWDFENRLPDFAPKERVIRERVESNEPIEVRKEKAALCLRYIPPRGLPRSGTYDNAFLALCSLVNEFGADEALELAEECDWVGEWDIYQKIQSILYSSNEEHGRFLGSLIEQAKELCPGDELEAFEEELLELNRKGFNTPFDLAEFGTTEGGFDSLTTIIPKPEPKIEITPGGSVLVNDKRGNQFDITYAQNRKLDARDVMPTIEAIIEGSQDDWRFNVCSNTIEKNGKIVDDLELNSIYLKLSSDWRINFPKDVANAFRLHAKTNQFDPYKDELERIEREATPISIDDLATRYFKSPTPNADVFMKKWLVGMVKRLMEPGTYQRNTLVIKGGQNIGKDHFLSIITGHKKNPGRVVPMTKGDPGAQNFLLAANSAWVVNLGEIEQHTRKNELGGLKEWLTGVSEPITGKHRESTYILERRFSTFGSCNEPSFLRDPTGNTRFLVFESGIAFPEKIDGAQLEAERDGILAMAMKLYRDGYDCELTGDEMRASESANAGYVDESPYVDLLRRKMEDRTTTSMEEIRSWLELTSYQMADARVKNQLTLAIQQIGLTKSKSARKIRSNGQTLAQPYVFYKDETNIKPAELVPFYQMDRHDF